MPWAAAAAVIAAGIGAYAQSDAARKASGSQDSATKLSLAEQMRQYNQTRDDTAAFRQVGTTAVGDLATALGQEKKGLDVFKDDPRYQSLYNKHFAEADRKFRGWKGSGGRTLAQIKDISPSDYKREVDAVTSQAAAEFQQTYPEAAKATNRGEPNFGALTGKFTMADFLSDPVSQAGYVSGLDQGIKGVRNISSAGGMRDSGQTLKALTQFGTDYTNQKAGDAYNRFYADQDRIYNRLANVAGMGQTATINTASLGQRSADNISGLYTGQGNARGASAIAQGNAWGGAANNIGNWYNSNSQLDKYLASRNSNTGTPTSNFYYTGDTAAGGQQYGG